MSSLIWLILFIVILVVVAQYVTGPFRLVFYVLAAIVAVYAVVRLTGIG